MLRSSCGMFSSETCLMATKSPFSRSSPLYTRPYAPFPISSPSICTRARENTVSARSAPPKKSGRANHEFPPDPRREAGGARALTYLLSSVLDLWNCALCCLDAIWSPPPWHGPGRRLPRRGRADQQSPAAARSPSRAPGGGHSACSRVWVGRELEDEGSRKTKAEDRERGETV
jgi:hypothetical protein